MDGEGAGGGQALFVSVFLVPQERVADGGEVDADLVRAAGDQEDFYERVGDAFSMIDSLPLVPRLDGDRARDFLLAVAALVRLMVLH